VLARARAALAQPEPQGPTDEELRDLWSWAAGQDQGPWPTQQHCFARAVLARWGRPDAPPVPEPGELGEGPSDEAEANFTAWFCRNYPGPDTIIHKPEWHAPKVFRAAAYAIARWGTLANQPEPVAPTRPDCFNFAMDFLGGKEEVQVRNYIERLESATRAAQAQPEPQGPTAWMYRGEPDFDGERWRESWKVTLDEKLARYKSGNKEPVPLWDRPAIEPVPQQEDVHYAWELHDAEGEWQAGGSANSLDDVQREGNRYLQTYSQDGPHKLIIERHCVTTIEPVPGVEGADG
jgi:hypothetical protein